jgi:hypothetical protein
MITFNGGQNEIVGRLTSNLPVTTSNWLAQKPAGPADNIRR